MKKKLLSLVLAGAMVASTSVSAFANTKDVQVQPSSEATTDVDIKGNVESSDGQVLPSSVTVTVPTNASFTVKKDGNLEGAKITITNKGDTKVSVIASKFTDGTSTNNINLVKEDELEENDRKKVSLKLVGGNEDIILTSQDGGKMYKGSNNSQEITDNLNFVIKDIEANDELNLRLEGKGSKCKDGVDTEAVSDNFRLVLKFKQVR